MGCVQSYFRKAHKAGLSPSSTQGSENAGLIVESPTEPTKQLPTEEPVSDVIATSPALVTSSPVAEHEVPNGHAPGTNGAPTTGLGLLGPGIAALAASTGTVAILGAAADTTLEAVGAAEKEADALGDATKGAIGDVAREVDDVQKAVESVTDEAKEVIEDVSKNVTDAQKEVEGFVDKAKETLEDIGEDAQRDADALADSAKEELENVGKDVLKEVEEVKEITKEEIEDVGKVVEDVQKEIEANVDKVNEGIDDVGKDVQKEVEDLADTTKEALEEVVKDVKEVKENVEAVTESITQVALEKVEAIIAASPLPDKDEEAVEGKQSLFSETEQSTVTSSPEPAKETNTTDHVTDLKTVELDIIKSVSPRQSVSTEPTETLQVDDESFPEPPPPVNEVSPKMAEPEDLLETISKSASIITNSGNEPETDIRAKRSVSELETAEDQQHCASEIKLDSRPASALVESTNQSRPASIVEAVMTNLESVVTDENTLKEEFNKDVNSLLAEVEKEVLQECSDLQSSAAEVIGNAVQSLETIVTESAITKDVESEVEDVSKLLKNQDDLEAITNKDNTGTGTESEITKLVDEVETEIPERALSKAEQIELVEAKAEEVVNEVVQTVTERVTKSATTIQATFRGHQARQNLKKTTGSGKTTPEPEVNEDVEVASRLEDITAKPENEETSEVIDDAFPPPPEDSDSDLLSGIDDKGLSGTLTTDEMQSTSTDEKHVQQIINVTINPEPVGSSAGSIAESDAKSDVLSTAFAESEPESLEAFLVDANRAVSAISESTVSIGDSVSALKGSETDSIGGLSGSEEVVASAAGLIAEEERLGSAATTIQATFRGFHERQNLQKIADDTQLPLPDPLPFEEPADEDFLPPPPDECDIEPPPPLEIDDDVASVGTDLTDTPRSPETGEKLNKEENTQSVSDSALLQNISDVTGTASEDQARREAEQLAQLQKPQMCDELPEHRGGSVDKDIGIEDVEILKQSLDSINTSVDKDGIVNGVFKDAASSAEVDDSSLSSAATKIQAGARGYLTRKLIKDTFSTTAPSITDSITDDGVHTSGSVETEVQRQSVEDQSVGVTAVVISNATEKVASVLENGTTEKTDGAPPAKSLSLDSQLPHEKKTVKLTSASSVPEAAASTEEAALQSGAATKIQSNFRGYRTRQRLCRENAVQMPTTSSGTPTTASESSESASVGVRASGEFHDMIVLTSPPGNSVGNDALALRQASTVGKRRECSDVTTPASHTDGSSGVEDIIKMGTAVEGTSDAQRTADMKGESVTLAATRIQAGFRGYKVRKQMRDLQRAGVKKNGPRRRRSSNPAVHQASSQASPPIKDKEVTLQDKSATTIQAGIRGFLVRKRRQEEKKAAVKIQAGFRGYQVRRDGKLRVPLEK